MFMELVVDVELFDAVKPSVTDFFSAILGVNTDTEVS
jgi:hypothetical protein